MVVQNKNSVQFFYYAIVQTIMPTTYFGYLDITLHFSNVVMREEPLDCETHQNTIKTGLEVHLLNRFL